MQKHIGVYRKTSGIYSQWLRSKRSKYFYAENEPAIRSCEAAKKYFDELGLIKIPTIKELQSEYAVLTGEKQQGYLQREQLKTMLAELETAHKNIKILLNDETKETRNLKDER